MKRFLSIIFILFITVLSFAGDLYTAKEKDLPDWARQGKFRFLRVDGGRIEAIKASYTDWGVGFSAEEREILWHVYDRHGEDMIRYIKQAHIDWIWITWSNGFSLKEESENRALCKHFIDLCHKGNIKVTAYLSLSNMFWHNMFIDEPQSLNWVQMWDGKPVNYGGSHNVERYLADIDNQGWRVYIKKRVQLALEAGFDALFFDNLQNEKEGMKTMFSEIQEMAVDFAKKTGKPKPVLFVNVHLNPERMDVNEICEAVWNEYGRSTPGVWGDVWWVDNIRKTKYIKGDLPVWKPQFYDIPITYRGTRETDIYTPKEEKLSVAEAVAFGSTLARNIEGLFLKSLIKKEQQALTAWEYMSQYNAFTHGNEHLYVDAQPVSHVLVLTKFDPLVIDETSLLDTKLQDMLSRASVQYDMVTIQRLQQFERDKQYQAVVVPPSIELMRQDVKYLKKFLSDDAKILVSESHEKLDDRFVSYGENEILEIIENGKSMSFLGTLTSLAQKDLIRIDQPYVLASLMEVPAQKQRVLHILNYDNRIVDQVTVDLSGFTKKAGTDIRVLSPDDVQTSVSVSEPGSDSMKLLIQNLDTYAVIVL